MIHLAPHSQVLEAPRPHKHNTNAGWTGGSESVEPILSYFVSPGKDEMADDERIYREDEVSLCCITHDVHIMRRQKVLVVGWRARGESLNGQRCSGRGGQWQNGPTIGIGMCAICRR